MTRNHVSLILILMLILPVLTLADAGHGQPFYGDYMSLGLYAKYMEVYRNLDHIIEEKDHKRAMVLAHEFISESPSIARGYFLKFLAGVLKKDLTIVSQSLREMTDKYVVMPRLYRQIQGLAKLPEDPEFKEQVKKEVEGFFNKREIFLKEKLKQKVNRKAILKELVMINDLAGDEDDFLAYIKEVFPYEFNFINSFPEIRKDRSDKRFRDMKKQFMERMNQWTGTAEEKVRGLLLAASELRYRNASLDFSPITDWNAHVASYIPRVLAADSKTRYYEVLSEMVAAIGEDHTNIRFPRDVWTTYSGCGVTVIYAGGKFLVRSVAGESLKKDIKPGDEIVSIGGLPTVDYLEKNKSIYPFVSRFFGHRKHYDYYRSASSLLRGKKDTEVAVGFKRPEGKQYTLTLKRDSYKDKKKAKPGEKKKLVELEVMAGNIYYFNIKRFWGSDIYKDFLELIKDLDTGTVKGVIFDIRENGGGNSGYGDRIFSHFIDKPLNNYIFSYFPVRNTRRMSTHALGYLGMFKGGFPIQPAKEKKFTCPVVVLTTPQTGSASEDFGFCFKYHGRGVLVGLPSAGATGQGHQVLLPGGGRVRICLNVDIYFSWRGLQPDHKVDYTVQDLAGDKDPFIKKAMEILTGKKNEGKKEKRLKERR
jgi:C-terminal processing protease CtpA/Prc